MVVTDCVESGEEAKGHRAAEIEANGEEQRR